MNRVVFIFAGAMWVACSGAVTTPTDASRPETNAPDVETRDQVDSDSMSCTGSTATFATISSTIFAHCTGGEVACHLNVGPGLRFGGDLDLNSDHAYAQLVGVAASGASSVRVVPGDANQSFLWRKLNDILAADHSEGSAMPLANVLGWRELPPDQLQMVRCWIESGAPNN